MSFLWQPTGINFTTSGCWHDQRTGFDLYSIIYTYTKKTQKCSQIISMVLPSVKFAEDKVLVFFILREKC